MKFLRIIHLWILTLAFSLLAGCASGPKEIYHSFTFDGRHDGWFEKVDLLAYSYGDQYHMVRNSVSNPRSPVFAGMTELPPGTGVSGPMPVGEFLYVKWRLKATGEVIEDRVDLRGRLPADMYMQTVTFVIDGKQLYVYVVTREEVKRRIADADRPQRTWLSKYNIAYEIYPTNTPKK